MVVMVASLLASFAALVDAARTSVLKTETAHWNEVAKV
jgi:hypothetical protein